VGADAWVGSLREVSGKVDEWTENGQVVPKAFTETPEGLSYLLAVRTKVLALAEHELSAKTGEVPTRLRDELGLLIDGIAAATLVDDPQVVIGVLTWQESSLAAHGYQGSLVVESMQSALDALAPAAGLILTEALKQGS
ncbi:MAG: hypothetical protein WBM90_12430, partial [Acidimicrobiia bacterium]